MILKSPSRLRLSHGKEAILKKRGSVSFDPLAYFDFDLLGPTSADVVLGSEVRLLVTINSDMVGWDLASETLNSDETRNSD